MVQLVVLAQGTLTVSFRSANGSRHGYRHRPFGPQPRARATATSVSTKLVRLQVVRAVCLLQHMRSDRIVVRMGAG